MLPHFLPSFPASVYSPLLPFFLPNFCIFSITPSLLPYILPYFRPSLPASIYSHIYVHTQFPLSFPASVYSLFLRAFLPRFCLFSLTSFFASLLHLFVLTSLPCVCLAVQSFFVPSLFHFPPSRFRLFPYLWGSDLRTPTSPHVPCCAWRGAGPHHAALSAAPKILFIHPSSLISLPLRASNAYVISYNSKCVWSECKITSSVVGACEASTLATFTFSICLFYTNRPSVYDARMLSLSGKWWGKDLVDAAIIKAGGWCSVKLSERFKNLANNF